MCKCFETVNAKLKQEDTQMDTVFPLSEGRVLVKTKRADGKRGVPKVKMLVAVFCPFCGTRY